MKIAIQANPSRGKEIISLLESLGGNTPSLSGDGEVYTYYIDKNNVIRYNNAPKDYKVYTLEEFEKEFPFKIGDEVMFPVKIGWASGKVTGLTYVENQLKYEVDSRIGGYRYIEPHKLSLYPMKEERNIKLTLDKAKEWYKKGGELKEIALQAFTEKELNPLPRSWEEFSYKYKVSDMRYAMPFKYAALWKLEQLRNCWWGDWEPEWNASHKYAIKNTQSEITIIGCSTVAAFLVFPTREMAEEFLKCFRDLIEQAGDLI